MTADLDTIGKRIMWAREEAGWSVDDLAEKIDGSPTPIGWYEASIITPNSLTIIALCRALDRSPNWLLGWGE